MATKKKSRLKNWLINFLLFLLLVVGLALIFSDQIKNYLIKSNGEKYAVATITHEEIQKNLKADEPFDFDAVKSASPEAVLRAQFSNKRLPVIGGVSVPSVKINLPIFKGLSNEALLWGAGTLDPNQKMGEGNYALASHRALEEGLLFRPLEDVKVGDLFYLTDLAHIYTYKTQVKKVVPPTAVEWIDVVPGKKLSTLITCNDDAGTDRIVVQGELQEVTPIDKATKAMQDAFNLEQKTY
ncbi:class A sortase [Enterococcus mediterraneensis]|uniref:class A sortase n=1 Tax=Enterococcus mediterraneensis TaxID=2364791 RepID=UPI000F05AD88|nr:class A sortase [Enterococcus mediterraneensis]